MDRSLIAIIESTIAECNRYRSPEATETLVSTDKQDFKIEFRGIFCSTCGFYDCFDDYRILLEEAKVRTKIRGVREIDDGAIVEFGIVDSTD